MALSTLSRDCKHYVFPSFHGEDVRRGLLGCLLKVFKDKGVDVFIDDKMDRNKPIGPELKNAIRGSMIAIVLFSKNYASSTWCLNELVEITKRKKEEKQIIMVVFYDVEPSDVKKQSGYFGYVFNETCRGKTEEEIKSWKQALEEVAQISGYTPKDTESDILFAERIASDISQTLNDSVASNDFEGLVGMENHIKEVEDLLSLDSDEVTMVGIWGPAGIGKTTIARALYKKLSGDFTHHAFIDSIKGKFEQNYHQDEHAFKLHLQEQLLSLILNQKDLKIDNLGAAKARLQHKKVLVVLDDVDELIQLEAMCNKICWFGSKSRIIITTKDKRLLNAHEINNVYNVGYPSESEALEILCQSAFGQNSPPSEFKDMAVEVTCLAGYLPLGLSVFGAYLRGMSEEKWKDAMPRLRTSLNGKIEKVLRFSYDALCDKDQELFLHIVCFSKNGRISDLEEYFDNRLDVRHGLQVLCDRSFISLINILGMGSKILVHNLLEQLAKEIVRKQSDNPGKRQFLVDPPEIRKVLSSDIGTKTIQGIYFDLSENKEDIVIDENAFERMSGLQFIKFKGNWLTNRSKAKLLLQQGLKFKVSQLRLLQWDECPMTSFPNEFQPQFLEKLEMKNSMLEKLWEKPILLPSLKMIDLEGSVNLKILPNLFEATKLEVLKASYCTSLVEIPYTIGNAINIKTLDFYGCKSLVVLPSSIWSLERLENLRIEKCSKLKYLGLELITSSSDISAKITVLNMTNTDIDECPSSIMALSCLRKLKTNSCGSFKVFPNVPESIEELLLGNTGIEEVPLSIQNLTSLTKLSMHRCEKLKILPSNINLVSLKSLDLSFCTQLKIFPEISTSIEYLNLRNTGIEEVPSSIWSWVNLETLNLEDCTSLFNIVVDSIDEELNLSNTETDSLSDVSETLRIVELHINLSGCKNLVSLPHLPYFVTFLDVAGCELLEAVDGFSTNPFTATYLNFCNCFNLSQKSRELILNCKRAFLPGKELPGYFLHKEKGDLLTINLEHQRPLPFSLRFKACLLLLHGEFIEEEDDTEEDYFYDPTNNRELSCCVWGVYNGVEVGFGSCKYHLPALLGLNKHLYFLESFIYIDPLGTDVKLSELVFEFNITGKYRSWRIEEYGVTLSEDGVDDEFDILDESIIIIEELSMERGPVRARTNFKGKPCVSDKPLQVYVRKKKKPKIEESGQCLGIGSERY